MHQGNIEACEDCRAGGEGVGPALLFLMVVNLVGLQVVAAYCRGLFDGCCLFLEASGTLKLGVAQITIKEMNNMAPSVECGSPTICAQFSGAPNAPKRHRKFDDAPLW